MVTSPLTPARVRVRMYQVGFGDCFLLTVEYAAPDHTGRAERHILFDLGSTHQPRLGHASMEEVATLVRDHTHGQLDILVITHRHKDHLYGFGVNSSAQILTELEPRLVLRPWTEDPLLPADASGPMADNAAPGRQGFAEALTRAQAAAAKLAAVEVANREALEKLAAAAEAQSPNSDAIIALNSLAEGERGRYVHAGSPIDVDDIVPGLRLTLLGPPTPGQYPKVTGQVSSDPDYWMLRLQRSLTAAALQADGPNASRGVADETRAQMPPGPVRWLVRRLESQRIQSVARLVRALDDALNNTSLILLLEVGNLSMLFPGDAQIENWRYTLDRLSEEPELTAKLAGIDLYKVGHHGSRNATPRTLYKLWTEKRPAGAPRLTALLSTCPDVHGDTPATAVPRATLLEALSQVAELHSTDDLPEHQLFLEVVAETTGGPFTVA